MKLPTKNTLYADDDNESIKTLFQLRAPALVVGLFLGIGISFIISGFEEVLARNIQVAFFLPFIIYIADATGTQTAAIYTRDLKNGHAKFINYLHKELFLGIIFGIIFGCLSGVISYFWLHNFLLSLSVAMASLLAIATAPLVALIIAQTFQTAHKDPAAGTGPIATVLQDLLSAVIYGAVASFIIL